MSICVHFDHEPVTVAGCSTKEYSQDLNAAASLIKQTQLYKNTLKRKQNNQLNYDEDRPRAEENTGFKYTK